MSTIKKIILILAGIISIILTAGCGSSYKPDVVKSRYTRSESVHDDYKAKQLQKAQYRYYTNQNNKTK